MTTHPDTAKRSVDAEAASWFTRNRNNPSRATRKDFALWLQTPEHARAYQQFEQLWDDLGALKSLSQVVPLPARKARNWRPALATAAALVCALLAGNLGLPTQHYQRSVAITSEQPQTLELPDGSQLSVNAHTRLRLDFNAERRLIQLDKGQFYIDVAADKERPLLVDAGNAHVRVVGTGFDLRRSRQELVLSVAHGQVALETSERGAAAALFGARQRAIYDAARGTLSAQALGNQEVADWRGGHVTFRDRELSSLIDEISLYRPADIVLADPALGRFRVSGNLDVSDPDALLNALPALLPVKTMTLADGRLRIERR
ncbi:MAG: FecR domain-containing protein [Pseudomonas sp.]